MEKIVCSSGKFFAKLIFTVLSTHHPAYPLNCPDPIPTPYSCLD